MDKMRELLDDDSFDFRFEVGVTDVASRLELHDRPRIVESLSTHFSVVRVKAQLDQLIEGLNALGVYDLLKSNPRMMKKLLTSNPEPLTVDLILDCFKHDFRLTNPTDVKMKSRFGCTGFTFWK